MQSPVALRPLAPPACFESPEAYIRAVYSARMSATAHGRNPRFLQRSANRRRGGKIVLFSRHDVSDRFRKPRPPHLRQATAIARGHGDTGRLRPSFPASAVMTASFNVPVPICFSFVRQPKRFRFPVPFIPYSHASRRRRMFFRAAFEVTAVRFPARSDGQRTVSPARFGKLTVMYTAMGLPLHAKFPLRRRIRPCRYPSPW